MGNPFTNFKPYAGAKQDILNGGSPMGGLFALLQHKNMPAHLAAPNVTPDTMPMHQPPIQFPMMQGADVSNPMSFDADTMRRRQMIMRTMPAWTRQY